VDLQEKGEFSFSKERKLENSIALRTDLYKNISCLSFSLHGS